jgi:hypothetical protein
MIGGVGKKCTWAGRDGIRFGRVVSGNISRLLSRWLLNHHRLGICPMMSELQGVLAARSLWIFLEALCRRATPTCACISRWLLEGGKFDGLASPLLRRKHDWHLMSAIKCTSHHLFASYNYITVMRNLCFSVEDCVPSAGRWIPLMINNAHGYASHSQNAVVTCGSEVGMIAYLGKGRVVEIPCWFCGPGKPRFRYLGS